MELLGSTVLGDVLDVQVAMNMLMLICYFHLATGQSMWRERDSVFYVRLFCIGRISLHLETDMRHVFSSEHCGVYLCVASTG